jgi:hypothetical protein
VIAERIHSVLFKGSGNSEYLDLDDIPYALDEAVQNLRASGLNLGLWATYVHIGI